MQPVDEAQKEEFWRKQIEQGRKNAVIWLKQANYDLEAAELSTTNVFHEWACFQSEQAAEKALKALIVSAGHTAPKIHKLSALIGIAKKEVPALRQHYMQISMLQAFTFIARYPFLLPGEYDAPHNYINANQAKQCIEEAREVIKITESLLKD